MFSKLITTARREINCTVRLTIGSIVPRRVKESADRNRPVCHRQHMTHDIRDPTVVDPAAIQIATVSRADQDEAARRPRKVN